MADTLQCERCRITVPKDCPRDPARCVSPGCPINERLNAIDAERAKSGAPS